MTERRPMCVGEWIGGSGGHRRHKFCEHPADWWHPDDWYAYCDAHLKEHDRPHYIRWIKGSEMKSPHQKDSFDFDYATMTNADFVREHAAAIDRMMMPFKHTWTTVGGEEREGYWGATSLDLPEKFFQAWRKVCDEIRKLPEHIPCWGWDHSKCKEMNSIVIGPDLTVGYPIKGD